MGYGHRKLRLVQSQRDFKTIDIRNYLISLQQLNVFVIFDRNFFCTK